MMRLGFGLRAGGGRRQVGSWLLALSFMLLVMVDLGGWTRLSGSGLSMADWQPLNFLPPLSESAWREWYGRYQDTPQFKLVNVGMTLSQFKGIFWLEYVHRLWGRLLGIVFFAPLAWFVATSTVGRSDAPRLLALCLAVASEGVLGWAMVASGLQDQPQVSHYLLAAHLSTAMLIFGSTLWVALGYMAPEGGRPEADPVAARALRRRLIGVLALVCLTIPAGSLVAGLHAGLIYNTYPLMGNHMLPGEAFDLVPLWRNFFDNQTLVQFDHRTLAELSWLASVLVWLSGRKARVTRHQHLRLAAVPVMATLQACLGIATLLFSVPMPLAAAHQLCGFIFAGTVIWAIRGMEPAAVTVRERGRRGAATAVAG